MEGYESRYAAYYQAVQTYLEGLFLEERPYGRLQEAMRYSLLSGGKRVRPVLTLAFCDALGGEWRGALPFACALELVHTYSLIHDDLPCMDNDDLRRGRPTCHRVYGETMAVLAGDALQAEAFRLIAAAGGMSDRQRADASLVLATACGANGMVAGQVLDVQGLCHNKSEVELLHSLKTGAMIRAGAELGCVAAGAAPAEREMARRYAAHLGLAFQIRDDMLDVVADQDEFGKPVGSDREEGKTTFVNLLGLVGCEARVDRETEQAVACLRGFPDSVFLTQLAQRLAQRRK